MPKISLPLPSHNGKILVKKGDKVDKDTVLFECDEEKTVQIPLLKHIKAKPRELLKYLTKKAGDKITIGETIAQKRSFFSKKSYKSPVNGKILSLDAETGILTILTEKSLSTMLSPIHAVVSEIENTRTIVLEFAGRVFLGKQSGGAKIGEIAILTKRDENVPIFQLSREFEHKLLVGYHWSKASIRKAFVFDCAVIGVEFEDNMEKLAANKLLADQTSSYMILGRDTFDEVIKYHGAVGTLIGSDRKLIVEDYES